jgi:hypothetical protein
VLGLVERADELVERIAAGVLALGLVETSARAVVIRPRDLEHDPGRAVALVERLSAVAPPDLASHVAVAQRDVDARPVDRCQEEEGTQFARELAALIELAHVLEGVLEVVLEVGDGHRIVRHSGVGLRAAACSRSARRSAWSHRIGSRSRSRAARNRRSSAQPAAISTVPFRSNGHSDPARNVGPSGMPIRVRPSPR